MFENIDSSLLRNYAPTLEESALDEWYKNNPFKRVPLSNTSSNKETRREKLRGRGFQNSGASFADTKGKSTTEVKAMQEAAKVEAVNHNKGLFEKARENAKQTQGKNFNPDQWKEDTGPARAQRSNKVDLKGTGFKGHSFQKDALVNKYDNKLQRRIEGNIQKGLLKEKASDYIKEAMDKPKSFLGRKIAETAKNMPHPLHDSLTAMAHGISLEETKGSMIDNFVKGMVSKFDKTTDTASKKYSDDALKSYKGINRISGESMNIDRMGSMSSKDIEFWKKIQRQETSKFVRKIGGNIDPFDNVVKSADGSISQNMYTTQSVLDAHSKQHETNKAKLNEVRDNIKSSSNTYSQFFNNGDKAQLDDLKRMEQELVRRIDLYDKGYNWDHIYGNGYTEDSKFHSTMSARDTELSAKRQDLNNKIQELSKSDSKQNWASINNLKSQLDDIDKQIQGGAKDRTTNFTETSTYSSPAHTKDSYRPTYGTSGFGLGFKNSMAASGGEHLARFGHYMNPFSAGGASFGQALMESAGIMNKSQRMQAAQARGFAKLGFYATPAAALGFILADMHEGKEGSEIAGEVLGLGGALHGWRMGTALGGATGSLLGNPGKFIGLAAGGIAGAVSGLLIGQGIAEGISDAMSQDSHIRKFAKKMSSKEMYVSTPDSRQSLTARGAALQKLAKSGLNDRGLLLGNEATVLKG